MASLPLNHGENFVTACPRCGFKVAEAEVADRKQAEIQETNVSVLTASVLCHFIVGGRGRYLSTVLDVKGKKTRPEQMY